MKQLWFASIALMLTTSFTIITQINTITRDGCYTSVQTDQNPSNPADPIYSWNASNVPINPNCSNPELVNGELGFPTILGYSVIGANAIIGDGSCELPYEPLCCYLVENNIVISVQYGSYALL